MEDAFDLVVIGAGPGGYVAAIRAAQLGLKTAIIDKNATLGGTCLNIGCIPSKALLQSSELYWELTQHAAEHGITCKEASYDLETIMQRKQKVVKSLVDGVAAIVKRHGIVSFRGTARFTGDPHAVEVVGEQTQTVKGKYFILATGSDSIPLPFIPFDEKHVVSSTGALDLPQVPKRMVVVGAGVIGVELASVYARLGSQVTIVEMLDRICPLNDRGITRLLQQALKKQGISFHLSAKVASAAQTTQGVSLQVEAGEEHFTLECEVLLVAIGRRPYTQGLGLESIGIEADKKGFIPINHSFQTAVPHIFAIGDLVDGPMLAHKASEEGIAVAELAAGHKPAPINYLAIPNVVYTSPELAAVGLTEEEAKSEGFDLLIGSYPIKGNARARCAGDDEGAVKLVADKASGRLLGMHILCKHASEMIEEGVLAIQKKCTLEDVINASHAHPTYTEAIHEAALQALGRVIHL